MRGLPTARSSIIYGKRAIHGSNTNTGGWFINTSLSNQALILPLGACEFFLGGGL
jgi:hypothetical protein